jgi:hypothetical protein
MVSRFLTLFLVFVLSSNACAWDVTATWEAFPVGSKGAGTDGFGSSGANGSVVDSPVHRGNRAFKIDLYQGIANDGQWPYNWPSTVSDGGEVWVRAYFFFPTGFDFTCNPVAKILRISSAPEGEYNSILEADPGNYGCSGPSTYGYVIFDSEWGDGHGWPPHTGCQNVQGETYYLPTNQWVSLELYVKASSSNQGAVRVWDDGTLIFEVTGVQTITSGGWLGPTGAPQYSAPHVLGYWNGGPTQNQSIYVDDMEWTNETPANRDAFGNPMIGSTPAPQAPLPPQNLRIEQSSP